MTATVISNENLPISGLSKLGATLTIDPKAIPNELSQQPVIVDCETDGKDNFVGIGICGQQDNRVFYFSTLQRDDLKDLLCKAELIGHNIKFDARRLNEWGIPIKSSQFYQDTMIMSYTQQRKERR